VVLSQPGKIVRETLSQKKKKNPTQTRHQWLTPAILNTQEAAIRKITVQSQPGEIISEPLSQKIGLVEWLKVKTLSSSPSTSKKN
jgi:hypothetical protein